MSKVFMVTPNERKFLEGAGDRMPLGALYVATAIQNKGHDVKVYDLNHVNEAQLIYDVHKQRPDAIGFSVLSSPSYKDMNGLMGVIGTVSPSTAIVAGGYHALARPQDFGFADYVVKGDGEHAMLEILEGIGTDEQHIQRVDFNETPIPNRKLLNTNRYQMTQNGVRTATLISSRGCPFSCVFCGNYDRKVRFRNPENLKEEMQQIRDLGFGALYFLDDAFTVNRKHAIDVSAIAKQKSFPFRITTRADLLDEDLVRHMSRSGLEIASLGIESGSDKVLNAAHKLTTTNEIEKAIDLLHKYQVDVKGFFIFGLPEETPEDAEQTIKFAQRLHKKGLTSADFYAMTPFPGTPIYENPEKFGGRIIHHDWDKYLEVGKEETEPVWETNTMSAKQIKHFMKKAKLTWKE